MPNFSLISITRETILIPKLFEGCCETEYCKGDRDYSLLILTVDVLIYEVKRKPNDMSQSMI